MYTFQQLSMLKFLEACRLELMVIRPLYICGSFKCRLCLPNYVVCC